MAKGKRTLETLEINGGALCLNFINTVSSRPTFEHDYLGTYSDLVIWGIKAGVYLPKQGAQLQKRAKEENNKAEEALQEVKVFRELLYRLFSSLITHVNPDKQGMATFVHFYAEAIANSHFVTNDRHYVINWEIGQASSALLWPIAYSAGQLLLSQELSRVKECAGCGWLFLDSSKNQTRRWCSMNVCGVSDKMQRYYRKSHPGLSS